MGEKINEFTRDFGDEAEILDDHYADLWAMSYGFRGAEKKAWGEQMERDRLSEIKSQRSIVANK